MKAYQQTISITEQFWKVRQANLCNTLKMTKKKNAVGGLTFDFQTTERQTDRQKEIDRITSLLSGGVLTNSKTGCLFGGDDILKEINAVWTPSSLGTTIN